MRRRKSLDENSRNLGIKLINVLGKETAGIMNYLNQPVRKNDKRMNPVADFESLFEGNVFYIICMGAEHDFDVISGDIATENRYKSFLSKQLYNEDYWLEIMPINATKSNAILQLKEMLGCDRIVCFGDGINDISMFEIAEECYAVDNAVDELKAIATDVIGSNEENGVAKWLEKNFIP